MSAFVVSKAHIDYIVHAALACGYVKYDGEVVSRENADHVGRALWKTNVDSVTHRYPQDTLHSGTLPGPCDLDHESLLTYKCPALPTRRFDPVVALKALDCYEYQSCELPNWRETPAYRFCDWLRDSLIGKLPGYDDAPWEIEDAHAVAA